VLATAKRVSHVRSSGHLDWPSDCARDRCLNHEDHPLRHDAPGFSRAPVACSACLGLALFSASGSPPWASHARQALPSPRLSRRALSRNAASIRMSLPSRRLSTRDWRLVALPWQKSSAATWQTSMRQASQRGNREPCREFFRRRRRARLLARAWGLPGGLLLQGHQHRRQHDRHKTPRHAAFGFAGQAR